MRGRFRYCKRTFALAQTAALPVTHAKVAPFTRNRVGPLREIVRAHRQRGGQRLTRAAWAASSSM